MLIGAVDIPIPPAAAERVTVDWLRQVLEQTPGFRVRAMDFDNRAVTLTLVDSRLGCGAHVRIGKRGLRVSDHSQPPWPVGLSLVLFMILSLLLGLWALAEFCREWEEIPVAVLIGCLSLAFMGLPSGVGMCATRRARGQVAEVLRQALSSFSL